MKLASGKIKRRATLLSGSLLILMSLFLPTIVIDDGPLSYRGGSGLELIAEQRGFLITYVAGTTAMVTDPRWGE